MEDIENEVGDFTRIGFELFFVETPKGNFVWDRGKGSFTRYDGTYFNYMDQNKILKVKFKGKHKIKDYCGKINS